MVRRVVVVVTALAEVSFVLSVILGGVLGIEQGAPADPVAGGTVAFHSGRSVPGSGTSLFMVEGKMAYFGRLNYFDYDVGPIVNLEKNDLADPSGLGPIELDYVFTILHSELGKEISLNGEVKESYFFDAPGVEENVIDAIERNVKIDFCGAYYAVYVEERSGTVDFRTQHDFSGSINLNDPVESAIVKCAVDAGTDTITDVTGQQFPMSDGIVNQVKEFLNDLVKPIAWKVFGPLLAEAKEKKQWCMDVFASQGYGPYEPMDPATGMTPEDYCQVPEVILGRIYYGLFDPPERVAFKYWQGAERATPQFCPNHLCLPGPEATPTTSFRGIHPLEDVSVFYQAQQFIEANESQEGQSFEELCDGGAGPYQDCVTKTMAEQGWSPTGNPGVWNALPGATMSAIMRTPDPDNAGQDLHYVFTRESNSTTLNGVDRYTADGRGVPDFSFSEGVTGNPLTAVIDAETDSSGGFIESDTVFKQLALPYNDCGAEACAQVESELDVNDDLVSNIFLQGTIYHEAEGEETSEITSTSSMKMNQWPIVLQNRSTLGYDVYGETYISGTGAWSVKLQFDGFTGARNVTIDIDAAVLDNGQYDFFIWEAFGDGSVSYDLDSHDTTLSMSNWAFDPSKNFVNGAFLDTGDDASSIVFDLKLDGLTIGTDILAESRGF